jgi:hypothetical protein
MIALDFLAACIVNCCSITKPAIHPIYHLNISSLYLLHLARV